MIVGGATVTKTQNQAVCFLYIICYDIISKSGYRIDGMNDALKDHLSCGTKWQVTVSTHNIMSVLIKDLWSKWEETRGKMLRSWHSPCEVSREKELWNMMFNVQQTCPAAADSTSSSAVLWCKLFSFVSDHNQHVVQYPEDTSAPLNTRIV